MIKLYIYCSVLIIGIVDMSQNLNMTFLPKVMEIVSYDTVMIVNLLELGSPMIISSNIAPLSICDVF